MPPRIRFEEFIKRVKKNNPNNNLTYNEKSYYTSGPRCSADCPVHGTITVTVKAQMLGGGCKQCGAVKTARVKAVNALKTAKSRVKTKYEGKITVSTNLKNIRTMKSDCTAECIEHGEFITSLNNLLNKNNKSGCQRCGQKVQGKERHTLSMFRDTSITNHPSNNRYEYIRLYHKNGEAWLAIRCPERFHGVFHQSAGNHAVGGDQCPKCAKIDKSLKARLTITQIKDKIELKYPKRFDLNSLIYDADSRELNIDCKKHGQVTTNLYRFISNKRFEYGCPKCVPYNDSKGQRELNDRTKDLGIYTTYNDRTRLPSGKEIDIFIPEHKLGIEYNGSYWHSEAKKVGLCKGRLVAKWHMRDKQLEGMAKGIFIAQFDDITPEHKVVNYIKYMCGKVNKVFGRKTNVIPLDSKTAMDFTDSLHIQGHAKGCTYYGLTLNEELVAVASFSRANSERGNKDSNRWELRRLVFNCQVIGGASKLLKHFIRQHPTVTSIISYSDNRWFTGGVYEVLGFALVKDCNPDYFYIRSGFSYHKSQFKHSSMKTRKNFNYDPELTEHQNCLNNGYYRFYDCGKKKWEMIID